MPKPLFELLDARTLFASITGHLWNDADSSTTFDSGEKALVGTTVFLDANANGRLDKGEATATTDANGKYTFEDVAAGNVLVGAVGPSGQGQTTPGINGTSQGGFDITVTGLEDQSAAVRKAFQIAIDRWQSIIIGDLSNVNKIDDLQIDVTFDRIDGSGGTLGQSGPTAQRPLNKLPYRGEMEFDTADVPDMIADGTFASTVTHEMAHVLGFGSIWSDLGLISGEGTSSPKFLGKAALKEYQTIFGVKATSVPVENRGGDGTADSHWPEASFTTELMTGYAEDAGVPQPLSRITAASMADMGYTVNLDAADTWNPYTQAVTTTTASDIGGRAFERLVTLDKNTSATDVSFGYRTDTAPKVGTFTASDAVLGKTTTLTASRVTDSEGDDIAGVSFYAESNGTAGLQGGSGGDTFLGSAVKKNGVFSLSANTGGLAAGQETFYAVATDALGASSRSTTTATLTAPPPPTRPNPVVATAQSHSSTLLQWKDRSDDEIGFRIELSDDVNYSHVIKAFNVQANTVSTLLTGLTHLTKYYVRVRSYGYGGASAYTRIYGVRV